ncbi:hypothetical protein, partial [Streptosporangium carneum]|uniref:hypothetical protein n=1 Tax=Streptosporangium carneum TaxID=47481 RepID=UPI0031E931BC
MTSSYIAAPFLHGGVKHQAKPECQPSSETGQSSLGLPCRIVLVGIKRGSAARRRTARRPNAA